MPSDVLARLRQELEENIDSKTRDGAQRFFKEEVKFHGVKSAAVRKIAAKPPSPAPQTSKQAGLLKPIDAPGQLGARMSPVPILGAVLPQPPRRDHVPGGRMQG